jgi:aspartyl-tRNA(Asn)/glutamyl-tRNA(Gln) amidotransferase subunit B
MEEGSLRCDANISVRKKGTTEFGTKVEVKNMNSISNVRRAIEFETKRQIEAIENNEVIVQETRSFDAVRGTTFSMRAKEVATDYRYFPEPDLPPLQVSEEWISEVRDNMPELPETLYQRFTEEYGLSDYDASVLIDNKEVATFYKEMLEHTNNFKAAANYLMGSVKGYLNKNALELSDFSLTPKQLTEIIALVDDGVISNAVGEQTVFPALIEQPTKTAMEIATELNVIQNSDDDYLEQLITEALDAFPDKVEEYKSGKKGLLGLFMGEVMKRSGGKADPKQASALLRGRLDE